MKYLLGSGMYSQGTHFGKIWVENNYRADIQPRERFILQVGDAQHRGWLGDNHYYACWENLGHVGALLSGEKKHEFCGWSAAMLTMAMLAYTSECDFLYKEEDCLAFGPWVSQMYADLGTRGMVFGRKMNSPPYMECSQSLFLVRHHFIPEFVRRYLELGSDGDVGNLPETKFAKMEAANPQHYARLSFGYDRERPINFDDKVWFAQKFTEQELQELNKRGLI